MIIIIIIIITITITIIIALWSSIPGERTLPWDRPGAPGHCQRLWRPWLSGDLPATRRWWKSESPRWTRHPKNGGDWWTSHFTWNINEYLRYIYWLVVRNIFLLFHSVGNVIIPTDFDIFRGVGIPPTSIRWDATFGFSNKNQMVTQDMAMTTLGWSYLGLWLSSLAAPRDAKLQVFNCIFSLQSICWPNCWPNSQIDWDRFS